AVHVAGPGEAHRRARSGPPGRGACARRAGGGPPAARDRHGAGAHDRRRIMNRKVTLSFDNGPTPEVTPRGLDVLPARAVRSTFLVVGGRLRAPGMPEITRRAVAEGHWIGNHTLTHSVPLAEIDDLAAVDREIVATQELIGDLSHPDRLFRPFGRGGIIDE